MTLSRWTTLASRWGIEGQVGVVGRDLDIDFRSAFDRSVDAHLVVVTERERDPRSTGASGPADAVDIGLRIDRHIEVHHMGDVVDIDPTRSDVRRDEDLGCPGLEATHSAGAGVLGFVAMDCFSVDVRVLKELDEFVGAVLGACEDQCSAHIGFDQESFKQYRLVLTLDGVHTLGDQLSGARFWSGLDGRWFKQDRVSKTTDFFGHGRREEQRLAFFRHHVDDLADVVDETHIQHAVRFVEHECFHSAQINVTLVDEIEQATGSRDEDINTSTEIADLLALAHASEDDGVAEVQVAAVSDEALIDLHRKFACWTQDERAGRTTMPTIAGVL